jgi:hypothetical protein
MGAIARQAVNGLVEIATGQAEPLRELDKSRKQFQRRQRVLLAQLPELSGYEVTKLPPEPVDALDDPEATPLAEHEPAPAETAGT